MARRSKSARSLAPHTERRKPTPPVPVRRSDSQLQLEDDKERDSGSSADTARYQRLRRIWWILLSCAAVALVIALVLTILGRTMGLFGVPGQYVGLLLELVAAILLIVTWVFDLKKVGPLARKLRREAQYRVRQEQASREVEAVQPLREPYQAPHVSPQFTPHPPSEVPPMPASQPSFARPQAAVESRSPVTSEVKKEPVETPDVKPAAAAKKPAAATKKPAAAAKKSATTVKKPAAAAKKPATTAKKPATTAKKPAAAAKKPVTAAEKPAAVKKPASESKQPTVATKKPVAANNKPAAKKPTAASKKPAAAAKKPAAKKPTK